MLGLEEAIGMVHEALVEVRMGEAWGIMHETLVRVANGKIGEAWAVSGDGPGAADKKPEEVMQGMLLKDS